MAYVIANDVYPVVLASRILGKGARKGGMPWIKYVANRILTFIQNVLLNQKLSEYHTGYRAFSAEVLRAIDYNVDSDDFVFDNEMLAQIFWAGYEIGEVTCPTKYFDEATWCAAVFMAWGYLGSRWCTVCVNGMYVNRNFFLKNKWSA